MDSPEVVIPNCAWSVCDIYGHGLSSISRQVLFQQLGIDGKSCLGTLGRGNNGELHPARGIARHEETIYIGLFVFACEHRDVTGESSAQFLGQRPRMSAALKPAGPAPTITTSNILPFEPEDGEAVARSSVSGSHFKPVKGCYQVSEPGEAVPGK